MKQLRPWILALPLLLVGSEPVIAAPERVQARWADDFIESIGVNVHLSYQDSPYFSAFPRVKAALADLGVRHVRDNIIGGSDLYTRDIVPARWRELSAAGIQTTVIANMSLPIPTTVDLLARSPAVFAGVEGPNEVDLRDPGAWAARLLDFQRQLFITVKSDRRTRDIPVLAPSLGRIENYGRAAALAPFVDAANIHYYTGGRPPAQGLPLIRQAAKLSAGSKRIIVTEAGYHNALFTSRTHQPATTTAAAKYIPRLLAAHFKSGFYRTFVYQLHDQTQEAEHADPEAHFGLLAYDFSPKPAYVALRDLIHLLRDPGASAFAPGTLSLQIHNAPAELETLLLQKRDGRFYLLLWQETESYGVRERKDRVVKPKPIRLEFDALVSADFFRPGDGEAPTRQERGVRQLNLMADDAITVIAIQTLPAGRLPL